MGIILPVIDLSSQMHTVDMFCFKSRNNFIPSVLVCDVRNVKIISQYTVDR